VTTAVKSSDVLVVEDDPWIRDAIEWALEVDGYTVATAENGQAALNLLDREQTRLILLDMRMPVMDGWTFARAYRERKGPHAPIVVITAAHDAERWAKEIEAVAHLAKPFEVDDLRQLVERYAS
jgi:two-component system chemotaxis response regulator CheY